MTDFLIQQLMGAGLTRQQATSRTAQVITDMYMKEDAKVLIAEAKKQVDEMQGILSKMLLKYSILEKQIETMGATLNAIAEASAEYGTVTNERAHDLIALYGALLSMNDKYSKNSDSNVQNASYVAYAYLGGQARRDINYIEKENN